MTKRRQHVSGQAEAEYAADVAFAAQFDDLLAAARASEQAFRHAQARGLPDRELYPLARARHRADRRDARRVPAQRAETGPRGYEDRIYRRKALARSAVHAWRDEAERLLTLRETHRLTGIPPVPLTDLPSGEAVPYVVACQPPGPPACRLSRVAGLGTGWAQAVTAGSTFVPERVPAESYKGWCGKQSQRAMPCPAVLLAQ